MLDNRLTQKQQEELLGELFGLLFYDVGDGHKVLYTEEGEEFYGSDENTIYDFTTLRGVFKYMEDISHKKGDYSARFEIRKTLGII